MENSGEGPTRWVQILFIMTSLGVIFVGQRNFFSLRGPVLSVLTNVCTKLYCSHWKKKLVRENNSIVWEFSWTMATVAACFAVWRTNVVGENYFFNLWKLITGPTTEFESFCPSHISVILFPSLFHGSILFHSSSLPPSLSLPTLSLSASLVITFAESHVSDSTSVWNWGNVLL